MYFDISLWDSLKLCFFFLSDYLFDDDSNKNNIVYGKIEISISHNGSENSYVPSFESDFMTSKSTTEILRLLLFLFNFYSVYFFSMKLIENLHRINDDVFLWEKWKPKLLPRHDDMKRISSKKLPIFLFISISYRFLFFCVCICSFALQSYYYCFMLPWMCKSNAINETSAAYYSICISYSYDLHFDFVNSDWFLGDILPVFLQKITRFLLQIFFLLLFTSENQHISLLLSLYTLLYTS